MKLSLMTYTMWPMLDSGKMTMSDVFSFAKDLGFEAIEFSVSDFDRHDVPAMKGMLEKAGLIASCINGHFGMASRVEEEFRFAIEGAKAMVNDAVKLGATCVMVVPAFSSNIAGPDDKRRAANRMIEGLRDVVGYGESLGINVTVEDFPNTNYPLGTIEELQYLLANVPGLRLTLDNGNFYPAGDDIIKAYDCFWNCVENVHIKDWEYSQEKEGILCSDGRWIRGGLHGKGLLKHRDFIAALKEKSYNKYIAFEYEGLLDHAEATREGVRYIKDIIHSL